MDPLSITAAAVGIGGLASIFTSCLECFELIQTGSNRSRDYLILETQLTNQQLRLSKWGEACHLNHDPRLSDPLLLDQIMITLRCIKMLLSDAELLTRTYGMTQIHPFNRLLRAEPTSRVLRWTSLSRFKDRILQGPKQAELKRNVMWAIGDKRKFEDLVRKLSDLIGDLEMLTRPLGITERQEILIQDQINSIFDVARLENIEASRLGSDDRISDAASTRLQTLRTASLHQQASSGPELNSESESTNLTYTTALETPSLLSDSLPPPGDGMGAEGHTDYLQEAPSISQNKRIMDDLIERNWSPRRVSEAKPIDTSNVGKLIDMMRHNTIVGIPANYPAAVLEEPHLLFSPRGSPAPSRPTNNQISTSRNYRASSTLALSPSKRLLGEMREIRLNPERFIDVKPLGDSLHILLGSIEGPPCSPYEGGVFHVLLVVPQDYPFKPPHCRFVTKIYHPNIDSQGRICLDILAEQWSPYITLARLLISIASILDDPGIEEPLVPEIAELLVRDEALYCDNARSYTNLYAKPAIPTKNMLDARLRRMAHDAKINGSVFLRDSTPTSERPGILASVRQGNK